MPGPFVHEIDPVIGQVGGVYLWWYGASYTFGFLGLLFWVRRHRYELELGLQAVYALVLAVALGVLLGGRVVEVLFYEWKYYAAAPSQMAAVWLGGMSTHGILLGAVSAIALFCLRYRLSFLAVADLLAVPGAYIMGLGRLGNFIDGQIAGSVTDGWWGVQFPDLEGYRHPVVLYDGLKNLLLVPFLVVLRRRRPPRGVVFGHFVLWYGFLRIFVDLFREYRADFLGFPPGQEFNLLMTVVGLVVIARAYYRERPGAAAAREPAVGEVLRRRRRDAVRAWQRGALLVLLVVPLTIPSDWTQDVPERYGKRHPGIEHSAIYPPLPDP